MCWMKGRVLWLRWSSGRENCCHTLGFSFVLGRWRGGVLFLLSIWGGVFFLQLSLAKACILLLLCFLRVAPILYPSMVSVLD
jgi:hypothetical protein